MLSKTDSYFLTIVKEGTLNRAAEVLYLSQPSLSKYIQRLERQLGTPLFDRSVSPMRLNDAGQLYYRYLMERTAREEELLARLDEINHTHRGTLRLGIPSYCGQCYLPWVLKEFSAHYPAVNVELFEERGIVIERAVADQKIDLGILHLPVSNSDLYIQELFSEQILLAAPREEVAQGEVCIQDGSILDFADRTFIMPHPEQKLGKQVAALLCRQRFQPKTMIQVQNVTTKLALTAMGLGVCFVPAGGLGTLPEHILSQVRFFRLAELEDNWNLVVLRRKGYRTPAYTEHFIQLFSQHGRRINQTGSHDSGTQSV